MSQRHPLQTEPLRETDRRLEGPQTQTVIAIRTLPKLYQSNSGIICFTLYAAPLVKSSTLVHSK
jgi:hypothetical protein